MVRDINTINGYVICSWSIDSLVHELEIKSRRDNAAKDNIPEGS